MRMIRPKLAVDQVTIAEGQEEFKPVTAALIRHRAYGPGLHGDWNQVTTAWLPSEEEIQRMIAGEPIYLSQLTFGNPMQGVLLSVGTKETAEIFGVEVES
jgi:hypothetical protein